MIRTATRADIPALTTLEDRSFDTDRLNGRRFRHMLTRANASLLVDEAADGLRGYALVLYRKGSSRARLYSIAVDAAHRRRGVARALLAAAERAAGQRGCRVLSLEVGVGNVTARVFYAKAGYGALGLKPGYYEDGSDALRMEKELRWPDT